MAPNITTTYTKGAIIATLLDEIILDGTAIKELEESLIPLVENSSEKNLIMDFSRVERLTSAILGLLLRISRRTNESGGTLKLCGVDKRLFRIFKVTKLDKIFDFYKDIEEAIESLN